MAVVAVGHIIPGILPWCLGLPIKWGLDWIDEDHQVSRQMVRYWTNFAKTGDPNGEDLPMWPRFDDASQNTLVISPVSQSEPGVDRGTARFNGIDLADVRLLAGLTAVTLIGG